MPDIPPVPERHAVERLSRNDLAHPGLLFDRYFPCWSKRSGNIALDRPVSNSLQKYCNRFNTLKNKPWFLEKLSRIHEGLQGIVQENKGREIEFRLTGPLAIGLGLDHPTENGFVFDRACGVPFLPGTSIKGLCRAWARACGKERHVEDIMGADNEPFTRGSVVFLPAYPATWPMLGMDCICNHHFDYYNMPYDKRGFLRGDYPCPLDIESPVPIYHLALRAETKFVFRIMCLDKGASYLLDRTEALLAEALEYYGIGARTAVGYGTMEPEKPVEGKWEVETLKGVVKTFISYSHEDEEEVTRFIARGAPFGVTPWRDKNDLMPAVGQSLDKEIQQALLGEDIAAVTLFLSEKSWNSAWVKKEIDIANQAGKHVIPVILDDSEQMKRQLDEWLRPENPIYIKATDAKASKSWISAIINEAYADMSEDVALYLGFRDSAIRPSILPESWNRMPVFDLRSPAFRLDESHDQDFRSWNPESETEYSDMEEAVSFLRRTLVSAKNIYVTGLAPLGIGGMVGKYWDRGSGPVSVITWNTYAQEEWRVERKNPSDDWSPETGKMLTLEDDRRIGHNANILLGHFNRIDQFETALSWAEAQDELKIGRAMRFSFPSKINAETAGETAMECALTFAWARKTYKPNIIYWFAGLPLALMPLVTHLTRATGHIVFMDENKATGAYTKAFTLV